MIGNAELVKRIAYHLAGRLPASVEVADLIQAGMLGLLEAAANYTADRGASFETYAGIRIRGAMLDALRKLDWAPRSVHRKARAAAAAVREIEAEFGREARDSEIAREDGRVAGRVPQDRSRRGELPASRAWTTATATTSRCWAGSRTRARIRSTDATQEGFREALAGAIKELPERERLVMSMYYDDELNLKEIGAVLKVTESRVCQLHGQALVRLKARLVDWRRAGVSG